MQLNIDTIKYKKTFFIVLFILISISIFGQLNTISSLVGNSFAGKGINKWVLQDIDDIYVTAEGVLFTNTFWDEGGAQYSQYQNGDLIKIGYHSHGWGRQGGFAVCVNSKYAYFGATADNEGGGLTGDSWPPKGYDWFGVERRLLSDISKGAPFESGHGGQGDTLYKSFLVVHQVPTGTSLSLHIRGIWATDSKLFLSCPYDNTIKVYDTETMNYITSWTVNKPGKMYMDKQQNLWVITNCDILKYNSGRVIGKNSGQLKLNRYTQTGTLLTQIDLPFDCVPTDICIDTQNRILISDAGINEQILIYTSIDTTPVLSSTFGVKGGIYSGNSGEFSNLKFMSVMGVGVDNNGNIYVANSSSSANETGGGGGVIIESYEPNGNLNWRVYGLEFVDCASLDEITEVDVYTKEEHFILDYSKPRGQECIFKGYTVNKYKYPDDPRLHLWSAGGEIKVINGHKLLFVNTMAGLEMDWLQVYRFSPITDGEIAIPSVLFAGRHYNEDASGWPKYQPSQGEWLWRDQNGNGKIDNGEYFTRDGNNAPFGTYLFIDDIGNIWHATETSGIRKFIFQGFDSIGNPVWNYNSMIVYSKPGEFDAIKRIYYDEVNDVMYIVGNKGNDKNQHWKASGPVIARYDNWSNNRVLKWSIVVPYETGSWPCEPINIIKKGNYIFVPYVRQGTKLNYKTGHINVYDVNTGNYVDFIEPSSDVGEIGALDIQHCISVHQRKNGEYIIFLEDDLCAKVLMYRWCPTGNCIELTPSFSPTKTSTSILLPTITLTSTPTNTKTLTPSPTSTPKLIVAPQSTINIDGVLNDMIWGYGNWNDITKLVLGVNHNNVTGKFKLAWDNDYFYIGVEINDNNLFNDSQPNSWDDDAVEIYLDMNRNRSTTYQSDDFQFIFGYNYSSVFEKNNRTGGVLFSTGIKSGGYTIEAGIPWTLLGKTPTEGSIYGFDIGINIDDNGGTRDGQLMWNGTENNWQDTSNFGDVKLGGAIATATNTTTSTFTFTLTPTNSRTSTPTSTRTFTSTSSPTNTNTNTFTTTLTSSSTFTPTSTPTSTRTSTPTSTYTVTNTATNTSTQTSMPTSTYTLTNTATNTLTTTGTYTNTATETATAINTFTLTWTPTNTNTSTLTSTPTSTSTNTYTNIPTSTQTNSATITLTGSSTFSPTFTNTMTITETGTMTSTNTQTYTNTPTVTPSNTATNTITQTQSNTRTNTPTGTATFTFTQTATSSQQVYTTTPTFTQTQSPTMVITETGGIENIEVYPNPWDIGKGEIKIKFKVRKEIKEIEVRIYTVGYRMIKGIIEEGGYKVGENVIRVESKYLKNLANGIYYVIVIGKDKENKKIISKPFEIIVLK